MTPAHRTQGPSGWAAWLTLGFALLFVSAAIAQTPEEAPDDLTIGAEPEAPAEAGGIDDDLDESVDDDGDALEDNDDVPVEGDATRDATPAVEPERAPSREADVLPVEVDEAEPLGVNYGAAIGGGVGCALAGGVTALLAGAAIGYSGILLAQSLDNPNGGCLESPVATFVAIWFLGMCAGGAATTLHGFAATLATGIGGSVGSGVADRDTGWMWLGAALGIVPAALGTVGALATNALLLGLLFRGTPTLLQGVDDRYTFGLLLANTACSAMVALLSGPVALVGAAYAERWFADPEADEPKRKRRRSKARRRTQASAGPMRF